MAFNKASIQFSLRQVIILIIMVIIAVLIIILGIKYGDEIKSLISKLFYAAEGAA